MYWNGPGGTKSPDGFIGTRNDQTTRGVDELSVVSLDTFLMPMDPILTSFNCAERYRLVQAGAHDERVQMRLPPRLREVRHAHCSSDKIRTWYGYRTQYSLTDMLESLVAHVRELGPKPFDYYSAHPTCLAPSSCRHRTPQRKPGTNHRSVGVRYIARCADPSSRDSVIAAIIALLHDN